MKEVTFGYHPTLGSIDVGEISVTPVPDLDEKVRAIENSECREDDWFYAPQPSERRPYQNRIFAMPKTHVLRYTGADSVEHLDFLIWALSFFTGTRLSSSEAGFVDATPIRPGKLVDFQLPIGHLSRAIDLAETFRLEKPEGHVPLMAAAIHALFLGQNPRLLEFESFLLLYSALDTCYRMKAADEKLEKDVVHADRVQWMCKRFAMRCPAWGDPPAKSEKGRRNSQISMLRNDAVHEALFAGAPLGFNLYTAGANSALTRQMSALVCRFIVALFGVEDADYVKTDIDTRNIYALSLR